jgi:hypothetical protein
MSVVRLSLALALHLAAQLAGGSKHPASQLYWTDLPCGVAANARATHKRCSSVSGTCLPRATEARCQASPSPTPRRSKVPTAIRPARPMLARQCIPTLRPQRSFASRRCQRSWANSSEVGTPRSGIGNFSKSKPAWRTTSASRVSSSSRISCSSRSETTSVIPFAAQSVISSWSHFPARGRPNIASRPQGTSAIQ